MTTDRRTDRAADLFWQDWMTVWQSELAALAEDRELREMWDWSASQWAGPAHPSRPACGPFPDDGAAAPAGAADGAGSDAAAGPAAAGAAPGAGGLAEEGGATRLRDRITDLERRLVALELQLARERQSGRR